MKRYGMIIQVRPEHFEAYKAYHAAVWPEVLATIRDCGMRNYSIFHRKGLLFAYFEYVGEDYEVDMAKMATDPKTQEWWGIMNPMQSPVEGAADGEWWSPLEEVFHTE